jgi:hypothetical protein
MLASISPLGERARASRWSVTVVAYLLGSTVGGAALGAGSALLGSLLPLAWRSSSAAAVVVGLLLAIGLALDLRVAGSRLPSCRRQVDEAWLGRYRGWVYGVGFGAQLGFGVVTIVTSATVYAVALLAGLSGSLIAGAGIGVVFGTVRALPVVALARVHDRAALHRAFRRLERWAPRADRLAHGSLAGAAVALVAVAVVAAV